MLIAGAKGFAKEVLEIVHQKGELDRLVFYDDVNDYSEALLYDRFPILQNVEQAVDYFGTVDQRFTIGIGNPALRTKLSEKFINAGGQLTSVISIQSEIGSYGVEIEAGCIIMGGVRVSNDVTIGRGSMIYYNSVITHDVEIGDFVEISPSVTILGRAQIGHHSHIATGAIIFPDVMIGQHVIVGAGSVVTRDVPDYCTVVGSPAKIIKSHD